LELEEISKLLGNAWLPNEYSRCRWNDTYIFWIFSYRH